MSPEDEEQNRAAEEERREHEQEGARNTLAAVFLTVEPSREEIAEARRYFDGDPSSLRPILELLNEEELGDLYRTVRHLDPQDCETAIERHPFASSSRQAKFRIALWMWNGSARIRWVDPRRFDDANRARFIRAMRVFVGLPATEPLPGE